jgi:hypothetical protein
MCDRTSTRIATAYLRPSNRILYSRIYIIICAMTTLYDIIIIIIIIIFVRLRFIYIRVYNGTQPVHVSRHHRDFLLDSTLFF